MWQVSNFFNHEPLLMNFLFFIRTWLNYANFDYNCTLWKKMKEKKTNSHDKR